MKKLVNPAFSLNQVHVFITSTMSTGVLHAHEVLIKSIYFMHGRIYVLCLTTIPTFAPSPFIHLVDDIMIRDPCNATSYCIIHLPV